MGIDAQDWTGTANTAQPQRQLGTFQAPPNAVTTKTYAVDLGTHSIGILLDGIVNVTSVQVSGHVTGVVYVSNLVSSTGFGTLYFVPVLSSWDTSIDISVTMGLGAQTRTLWVSEILDPEIVGVFQQQPVDTAVVSTGGAAIITDANGTSISLGVSEHFANAAPWQAAASTVEVAVALALGAASTVITAVGGQRAYMHSVSIAFDATSAGNDLQIRDGVGGTSRGRISASSVSPPSQDWKGRPMTTGNAVEIFANGAAMTPRGTIAYTQAA